MVKCLLRILTAALFVMMAWSCADDRQRGRMPGVDIVSRLSGTMADGRYSEALSIADTLLLMPEDSVSAEARKIPVVIRHWLTSCPIIWTLRRIMWPS